MCNFCNSVANTSCGYSGVSTASSSSCSGVSTANSCGRNSCGCGWWGCGQRLCRDCCGNIRVRQSGCGCSSCSGCGCGNGTAANGASASGNGGFTCLTFCGQSGSVNAAATANTATVSDAYYARQYGLLPYGGCGCGGYSYGTVMQTT